ncbi:MAG: globin, partial [Pseudomonadota bacterium]
FYRIMSTDPAYAPIWHWHSASAQPDMLADTADRLSSFLIGWMGGPRVYQEKFGPISIPGVHAHLPVSATERDMWLGCMAAALEEQSYPEHLRTYLLEQLAKPANMIMARAQHREA